MAYEYFYQFTERAKSYLDEVISFLTYTLGSPTAAKDFYNKVADTIDDLCQFPKRGPEVINDYLDISGIRKKAVGSYLIYYLSDEESKMLTIFRIVYRKRDTETVLRELN